MGNCVPERVPHTGGRAALSDLPHRVAFGGVRRCREGPPALAVSAVGRLWGSHAGQARPRTSWGPHPTVDSCPAPGVHPGPCTSRVPCPTGPAPDSHVSAGRAAVPTRVLPLGVPALRVPESRFSPLHLSQSYLSSQDTPQMSFQMSSSRVIFRSLKPGRIMLLLKASVAPTALPTRPRAPHSLPAGPGARPSCPAGTCSPFASRLPQSSTGPALSQQPSLL